MIDINKCNNLAVTSHYQKMSKSNKSTLTEVAKSAQTSAATVDRVLNNRGGVSEKLKNRVLDAAKALTLDRDLTRIDKPFLRFSVLINRSDKDIYARVQKAMLDHQDRHVSKQFACYFHYFSSQSPEDICQRIRSVKRGFDGVIIIASDHSVVADELKQLSRKIPVVTLVSDIPNSGRIHYAGSGNRIAGKMAGGMMGRFQKKSEGAILIITRLHHYTVHSDRELGFREVLSRRYPEYSPTLLVECNHGDKRDLPLIQKALAGRQDLVGVYNVSSWNISLIQLMQEDGLLDDVVTISHGVNRRSRDLLQNETIDLIVEYRPESYAVLAIDALLDFYDRRQFFAADQHHQLEVFTPDYLPPLPD